MNVAIFGSSDLASLAWYVLTHDSPHSVVGFTVDAAYRVENSKHGLPVVAFEELEKFFSPHETGLIAPLGLQVTKGLLAMKLQAARARGYGVISYISSRATTWPDLVVGEGSMIFDGVAVEPFVRMGDGTIVRGGCHVSHHVTIEGNCYLAPRVTLAGNVTIEERCFLGLGSLVHSNVHVARGCFIAAGARVTKDTEEDGIYEGAPAIRRRMPASRMTSI